MGSTDGTVLGIDEGNKLESSCGKLYGTILGNVYGITLGRDARTELFSLDG